MKTIFLALASTFFLHLVSLSQTFKPFDPLGIQISGCHGDREGELLFLYTNCGFAVDSLVVRLDSTYGVYSNRNDYFINEKNEVCKWKPGNLSVFEGCSNLFAAGAGDFIPPGSIVVIQMTSDITTISSLARTCQENIPIYVIANDCIRTDEAFPIHGVRKDSFGLAVHLRPDFKWDNLSRYYVAYSNDPSSLDLPLNLYSSYPGEWSGHFECDSQINVNLVEHVRKLLPDLRITQAICDSGGKIEFPIQSSRYSVDGGNTWSSDSIFEDLPPGDYLPSVWDDQSNCQVSWIDSVSIEPYYSPEFLTIWWMPVDDTICEGATANLYPEFRNSESGAPLNATLFEFSIDSGITYQESMLFNGLKEGTYNLAIREKVNPQCVVHYPWTSPPLPKRPEIIGFEQDSLSPCETQMVLSATGENLLYSIDGVNYQSDSLLSIPPNQPFTAYVRSSENENCIDSFQTVVFQGEEFLLDVEVNLQSANFALIKSSKGPYFLEWSTGDTTKYVNDLPLGFNYLIVTDGWGCSRQEAFYIDDVNCQFNIRDSVVYSTCESTGASIYLLSQDLDQDLTFDWSINTFDGLSYIKNVPNGTYTVEITKPDGCAYRDSFTIVQDSNTPIVRHQITVSDCEKSIYQLDFSNIIGGTGPFEVTLNDIKFSNLIISDISYGDYSWKITDSNGCTSIDSLLSLPKIPNIQVQNSDTMIYSGSSILLSAIGDIDLIQNFSWVFPTGSCFCTDTLLQEAPEGLYRFTYSGMYGQECNDPRSFNVLYSKDEIFIPNAISPNNDGNNDVFEIFAPNYSIVKLEIYDRWGGKIYNALGPNFLWDGKVDQFNTSQGVFIYLVELKSKTGDSIFKTGSVAVLQ